MFDCIVIGGGPGGYHAALKAAEAGLKTALVEERAIGGVCLNEGCVPTKTLLNSSGKLSDYSSFAVQREAGCINLSALRERKEAIQATLQKSISSLLKRAEVTLFAARAVIDSVSEEGVKISLGDEIIIGRDVILATGSKSLIPAIPGADLPHVATSREMLELNDIPGRLVVVGGGVIGLEMATFYAEAGAEVTIVEAADSLGGALDRDVEKILSSTLKKKCTIMTKTMVTSISESSVTVEGKKGVAEIPADKVLLSVGRVPNIENLGLERAGVLVANGAVVTDDCCRTAVPHIYAIGDMNGRWLLAHTAYAEAESSVKAILGQEKPVAYESIPSVIYTHPEVASVGITEQQAKEASLECTVKKRPMGGNGRFLAETAKARGLCKVILDRGEQIIGIHLIGPYAGELITAAAILVQLGVKASQLEDLILPHPTVGEILKETILEG